MIIKRPVHNLCKQDVLHVFIDEININGMSLRNWCMILGMSFCADVER